MSFAELTPEVLRSHLREGMTQSEIARRYGLTRQALSQRVKRLELTATAAASMVPEPARRYAASQLDAMEQLTRSIGKVNLLMDACDDWLREVDADGNATGRYEVGPRSSEVMVTYEVECEGQGGKTYTQKRTAPLQELLDRVDGRVGEVVEVRSKHADPRELLLKTAQEVRQTVGQAADIARMLADARAMQALREAVIEEVRRVDPDSGARIADAVRRSVLLQRSLGGLGAVAPTAGEPA